MGFKRKSQPISLLCATISIIHSVMAFYAFKEVITFENLHDCQIRAATDLIALQCKKEQDDSLFEIYSTTDLSEPLYATENLVW